MQTATVLLVLVISSISGLSQNLSDSLENQSLCDSVNLRMDGLLGKLDTMVIIDLPVSYEESERMLNAPHFQNFRSSNADSLSVYEFLVYLDRKFEHIDVIVEIGEDVFELGDINARFKYKSTILRKSEFLYQHKSEKYRIKVLIN